MNWDISMNEATSCRVDSQCSVSDLGMKLLLAKALRLSQLVLQHVACIVVEHRESKMCSFTPTWCRWPECVKLYLHMAWCYLPLSVTGFMLVNDYVTSKFVQVTTCI